MQILNTWPLNKRLKADLDLAERPSVKDALAMVRVMLIQVSLIGVLSTRSVNLIHRK